MDTTAPDTSSTAATPTTSPSSPAAARPVRRWPLRGCLALNLLGAGVPGAVLLVAPDLAPEVAGASAEVEVARLVGAIWVAIGLVSLALLRRPEAGRGLLAVQALYKTLYVVTVGTPALISGTASLTVTGLTVGFAAVAVIWTTALVLTRPAR